MQEGQEGEVTSITFRFVASEKNVSFCSYLFQVIF